MDTLPDPEEISGASAEQLPCQLDIQHWYGKVYALCRSKMDLSSDAEDATQETFARGFAQLSELRSESAIGSWIRQIARNVCVDMLRRNIVRKTTPLENQDTVQSGDRDSLDATESSELSQLISTLPDTLQEIIRLHYYENMTYDEMAAWLNIARSTVNERLSKARCTLRQRLAAPTESVK